LHGFSVLEDDLIVSFKCDNYYEPEAENDVINNDKDLNMNWRLKNDEINLSAKDKI
tara:strand:- start:348 stop:515 length:168 start_codon:yes stop_codon:yes gene_type:complete